MKYVLDSSVALKWVLAEPDSAKALVLRADLQNAVHELLAPDIFPVECAHALTKAERQARIATPQGSIFWTDIMTTCPQLHATTPLIPRAYVIASKARISIYDCVYVALAEREHCDLITADNRLASAGVYSRVILLASMP